MDLSITSWGVLFLQKAFSLHMPSSTFMTLKKQPTFAQADVEMKALIVTPSEPSMTCCIDAILMLLFISRPIKSCERNLQSSTQMFVHGSIFNKEQMVEGIIFLLPMKLL
jgi:hypothetical protein